jgi:hypothetical protein
LDEINRRSLHQLIMRATERDAQARAAIEEMIISLDRSGAADDVSQALQMLKTLGSDELYQSVVTRLQENDPRDRQQYPLIG